jgi:hypothetical protein
MTVFGDINDDRFLPSEKEVSDHRAENNSKTEPGIVSHKDQHKHQGKCHLHQVEEALIEMHHREHCWSKIKTKITRKVLKLDESAR